MLASLGPFRLEFTVGSQYNLPSSGLFLCVITGSISSLAAKGCPRCCGFHQDSSFLLNPHWWCHHQWGYKQHIPQMTLQIFHSSPFGFLPQRALPEGRRTPAAYLFPVLTIGVVTKYHRLKTDYKQQKFLFPSSGGWEVPDQAPAWSCCFSFLDPCSQFVASTGFLPAHRIEGPGSSGGGAAFRLGTNPTQYAPPSRPNPLPKTPSPNTTLFGD